jgi:hypothetical protein
MLLTRSVCCVRQIFRAAIVAGVDGGVKTLYSPLPSLHEATFLQRFQGLDVTRFAAKQNLRPCQGRGAFAHVVATFQLGTAGGCSYRNGKSMHLAGASKCPQWLIESDPMHPGKGGA